MQLIHLLFQKLDEDAKQAIAKAMQTSPAELDKGLHQISRLFLGVLVQPPLTSTRIEGIQQVIDEGGHTGELLSNLPNLLADEQRSSLLTEIGTKIFNHFYEGDIDILTEKLTMVLGIRKPVIQSLLGLTPPLVLGALGLQMRKEKWTTKQLQTYLEDQQADVQAELSPYLTPHLIAKNQSSPPVEEVNPSITPKKEEKMKSKFNFFTWLPWLLLGLLVGVSWWYIRTLQNPEADLGNPLSDSLSVLTDDTDLARVEERLNQKPDTTLAVSSAPTVSPEKPLVAETTPPATPTTPTPERTSGPEKTQATEPKVESSNVSSALKSTFQSGSAEIKDDQMVKSVVSKWQENKSGVLVIEGDLSNQLTEDQAYALRERLFQLGVPVSAIRIEKSKSPLQVTLK